MANGMECAVCYERVQGPLRLRCGHVYCTKCVEDWYVSSKADRPGCPSCRRPIVLKALDEVRTQSLEDSIFAQVLDEYLEDWTEFAQDFEPMDLDHRNFFRDLNSAQQTIKALWSMKVKEDEILDFIDYEHWIPWRSFDTRKPWIRWYPPKPHFRKRSTRINKQKHIKIPPPIR